VTTGALDKPVSLFCGCLIDGSGGPVLERALITIKDGIITSVEEVRGIPSGTEDLGDCTIIPGLVDCHVHLFMSGTTDPSIRKSQLSYSFDEAGSIIERHLAAQLSHGVLTVRDGGDYGGHALRYKREVMPATSNPITMLCAGRAWHAAGRYGSLIGRSPSDGITLAQAISESNEKPDHVKIVNSGINSLMDFGKETAPQFSLEELTEAVREAAKLGLKTMVHANSRLPVRNAAEAGCHSIEHGFFMGEDNLKLLADRRIYWVPTVGTMKAYAEQIKKGTLETEIALRNLDHQLGQMRIAQKLGVPMAIGTDCGSLGVHHGAAFSKEIQLFIEAGFSLNEVIRCATTNGAKLLGVDDKTGELQVGKPATFIVVKSDPQALTEALKTPERVYFRGIKIG
jgi:imidazolonepropionase-like amidohydrolase